MTPSSLSQPPQTAKEEGLFVQPEWRFRPWGGLNRKPLNVRAGRGGSLVLLDHPRGLLVERAYRHGGLRRFFWSEWFWHHARPSQEFRMHCHAFEARIPTVEPVGWREQAGKLPFFRRYWYYTVYLPGSQPLPSYLHQQGPTRFLVANAAHILKAMYDQGIFHADLNLNNWLVWMADLRIIDFDKAKFMAWDPHTYLVKCFKRMIRSGIKLGLLRKQRLFLRFLIVTCRAFQVDPRDILQRLPHQVTQVTRWQRLRWRLSGGHHQG